MRLPITQTTRTSNYKKKILSATERHLHKTDFWQGPGITKKQKKKWQTIANGKLTGRFMLKILN